MSAQRDRYLCQHPSGAAYAQGAGPAPGTVLGGQTWEQARGLRPDEFLDRYKQGQ